MAFSDYKSLEQVQREFQIRYQEAAFLPSMAVDVSETFRAEFQFNLTTMDAFSSEGARCELVIFPVLREVYKAYAHQASLWVQKLLTVDARLSGTPDYMVSAKSALGKTILEPPFLILVEAKRNDFEQGWGQCLAELVAADQLNHHTRPVYGVVTDGKLWEFGRLFQQTFTKNLTSFTISDLEALFCGLHGLFELATRDLDAVAIAP